MTGNLTGDRLYYALHGLIKKRLGLTKSPFASSYGKNTRSFMLFTITSINIKITVQSSDRLDIAAIA
jgi:hypothetical protein